MKRLAIILVGSLFCFWIVGCNTRSKANRQVSNFDEKPIADTTGYQQGKLIFKKYCHTCHIAPELPVNDNIVFESLFERLPLPPEQYFIKYIQDSKSLKASGDKHVLELAKQWNSEYEHNFKDSLSMSNFSELITYIKEAVKLKAKI